MLHAVGREERARRGRERLRALRGAPLKGASTCARKRARSTRRTRARRARPRGWRCSLRSGGKALAVRVRRFRFGRLRACVRSATFAGTLPPARGTTRARERGAAALRAAARRRRGLRKKALLANRFGAWRERARASGSRTIGTRPADARARKGARAVPRL